MGMAMLWNINDVINVDNEQKWSWYRPLRDTAVYTRVFDLVLDNTYWSYLGSVWEPI